MFANIVGDAIGALMYYVIVAVVIFSCITHLFLGREGSVRLGWWGCKAGAKLGAKKAWKWMR